MCLARRRWMRLSPVCLLIGSSVVAQAAGDPLFAGHELLQITISAPFSSIMRNRSDEEFVPGTLSYSEPGRDPVVFDIGLRPRGNFRLRADLCDFAPLSVNFVKSQTANTLFENQDKLKLVTHCQYNDTYEQSVVSEYLVYRVFNVLTDVSFRARLLRVVYVDTGRENREIEAFAFFIEHKDRLAQRQQLATVETRRVGISQMPPAYANLTSVFHFFIGNTDFSHIAPEPDGNCCHNHSLFANDAGVRYSVPYDFDMSGFVKAPYSFPSQKSRLRHVRQRRYQGWCVNNDHLAASVALMVEKRAEINDLIRAQQELKEYKRKSLMKFLDDFYKDVETPRKVEKKLIRDCRE